MYSTAHTIPVNSGPVDTKKRTKTKQNEERDWMSRMLTEKVRRRVVTRAIYRVYPMHLYFSRKSEWFRTTWAMVSLLARPSLFVIGVLFVLKEVEFRFLVGTPSVCEARARVIWDARLIPNKRFVLAVYDAWSWKDLKVSEVSARNFSMKASFVKYLRLNVSSSMSLFGRVKWWLRNHTLSLILKCYD